jgi:hypothetical protein
MEQCQRFHLLRPPPRNGQQCREDYEISMLALHLLQNCMVHTLMLQQVLAKPHWSGKLTARDLSALTPLFWEHGNPYGRFELDMDAQLPII